MEQQPDILEGIEGDRERAACEARFLVLSKLNLGLTDEMTRRIARLELTEKAKSGNTLRLSFHRAIGKAVVGMYGDLRGISFGEVELMAEGEGVDELIYGSSLDTPEASSMK